MLLLIAGAVQGQPATTQPAENIAAVRALLKSKSAEDRWRGVNMLAEAQSPEAARLLISELDDNVYSGEIGTGWDTISVRAIQLLGRRRDPSAVEPLIRIVQRGPVPYKNSISGVIDHTAVAAESLGMIGDHRAVPALTLALTSHVQKQISMALKPDYRLGSDSFVTSSIEALGRLGDPRALSPLMKIVTATYAHLGGPPNRPPVRMVSFAFSEEQLKAPFEALAALPGEDVSKALSDYAEQPPAVTEPNAHAIQWATDALAKQKRLPATQPATQP